MKFLAIDTSGSSLIAVACADGVVRSRIVDAGKSGHSSLLTPAISEVLEDVGITPAELDFVAAVMGPGSFTGIRIGASTASAIAYATGCRRISVTSFELIAYSRTNSTVAVAAGHGNVYAADVKDGKVINARFYEAAELKGDEKFEYSPLASPEKTLYEAVRDKAERGEFVKVFEPYYMRKSQAERNADEI